MGRFHLQIDLSFQFVSRREVLPVAVDSAISSLENVPGAMQVKKILLATLLPIFPEGKE
jgi:hypothetical protein